MRGYSITGISLLILLSCNPAPEPINFGQDECSFCRMSIVDQRYGAEVLTSKGKVFKYDAIECMINALCENTGREAEFLHSIYTVDFSNPGQLVDAKKSFYLYSEALPSPMGAYLTGFEEKEKANEMLRIRAGTIYSWKEVALKVIGTKTCMHEFYH